jgi:hypothetical protein
VLGEGAVHEQMHRMLKTVRDPRELNNVRNWMTLYGEQSSLQNARTALQTFNVTMADIGDKVLPQVNRELADLKAILTGIDYVAKLKLSDMVPAKAQGLLNAPVGDYAKGAAGLLSRGPMGLQADGILGAFGVAKDYMNSSIDKGGSYTNPGKTGHAAQPIINNVHLPQQNLTLNIDGMTLAQTIVNKIGELYRYDTNSPAMDGSQIYGP